MIFLLLSIVCSTVIAIVFKVQNKLNIKLFPVIVINYFAATFLGFLLNKTQFSFLELVSSDWIYSALGIGALLIVGFYLIGYSTQKIGIAITTISNKMSVVVPMLFSMLFFTEVFTKIKIVGIFIALLSVFFSVYRKRTKEFDLKFIYLPVLLFITIGAIDSIVKLAQSTLTEAQIPIFTAISFGISGLTGVAVSFFNDTKFRDFFNYKIVLTGLLIGTANFGSMYFMIYALNHSGLDSSVVFGVNNIGVISLSILFAFFIFKEKLKFVNWVGVLLSIFAIILLTGFYKLII
ncbi:MAG: DMT family transporter [Bacteroidales bacterium]|nr:DMT family transporter [Bacteroidales bacterium]